MRGKREGNCQLHVYHRQRKSTKAKQQYLSLKESAIFCAPREKEREREKEASVSPISFQLASANLTGRK